MSSNSETAPHILCVSWDPVLSKTREILLSASGYNVTAATGKEESLALCSTKADLLLLGHSVPREQKQLILFSFRKFNSSPTLSLLATGQERLPDVEYAVEFLNPRQLLQTIQRIIPPPQGSEASVSG